MPGRDACMQELERGLTCAIGTDDYAKYSSSDLSLRGQRINSPYYGLAHAVLYTVKPLPTHSFASVELMG